MAVVGRSLRLALLAGAMALAACAPWQPVGDGQGRQTTSGQRVVQAPPLWYEVNRGDTLYSIAFRYGLDWRELARWNGIGAPYTIRPGQELRMSAPPRVSAASKSESESAGRSGPSAPGNADKPAAEESETPATGASAPAGKPAEEPGPPASEAPGSSAAQPVAGKAGPARSVAGIDWQWPTAGKLTRSFDPSATRKGIGIAGKEGQAVSAAAAGQVVYSGTALIGYGELVIIKHSDSLLSAYGHNRRRLVAEGDRVGRGQKIAEMGQDDRREELLHFEIRKNGEPVNPLDYLPRR